MKKTFQCDGLNIWITNVPSKEFAAMICLVCRYGVTSNNLIEVEKVPTGVPRYAPGKQPRFEPNLNICIDNDLQ